MGLQRKRRTMTGLLWLAALAFVIGPAGLASAQDNGRGGSRLDIPDDATSEDNRTLERILERFPDADADGDGILTADEGRSYIEERTAEWEERRDNNRRRGDRRRGGPTHRDVPYGDHAKQQIDLYLAPAQEDEDGVPQPTPLVVYFHAGQFITGDKGDVEINTRALLASGISVASVGYRDARETPFPSPFEDAARALQFLRLNAEQYNLDPERFATAGSDAGANLALYLALHDDLAQRPNARQRERRADRDVDNDPYDEVGIMMQSTRVMGAMAISPLASFDPRFWEEHELPLVGHERYLPAWLGVNFLEPFNDRDLIELVEDLSPAALCSADDPPLLLLSMFEDLPIDENTLWTIMRLHPRQCQLLAEQMESWGLETTVRYRNMPDDPGTGSADFFPALFGISE